MGDNNEPTTRYVNNTFYKIFLVDIDYKKFIMSRSNYI